MQVAEHIISIPSTNWLGDVVVDTSTEERQGVYDVEESSGDILGFKAQFGAA